MGKGPTMKDENFTGNLEEEILRLKKERNAVILAHFYQESEIQEIADFVEDSLGLARRAQEKATPAMAISIPPTTKRRNRTPLKTPLKRG